MARVRKEARRHRARAPYPPSFEPAPWLQQVLDATSEKAWQKQVTSGAETLGWHIFHDSATNRPRKCRSCGAFTPGPRNVKGFPDLLMLRGRRLVVAELKDEYGEVSPEQQAWLDWFRAVPGVEVYVWRPRDVNRVTEILTRPAAGYP
jgi:hypothetical protein